MEENTLKTSIEVQEMTCKEFLNTFLPNKTSVKYTQASMYFHERIASVYFDHWPTEPLKSVILLLQETLPKEMVGYRGVGIARFNNLMDAFKRAGINFEDIPEYKKMLDAVLKTPNPVIKKEKRR